MIQTAQNRFYALIGACVLSFVATAGWSQSLTWLGTLGGDRSAAWDASANGAVVVGWVHNANDFPRAFRWTQAGGMEDLNITYASLLTNGSELITASAISPDGRYIVGWGFNAATGRGEAYLLDTRCVLDGDVNSDGIVDDADLLIVLFNFGRSCSGR